MYVYIYIPGTCLASILVVEPSKTRSFPIKTRVIWVGGILKYIIYLLSQFYVLRVLDLVLEGILIHEISAVVFIYCFSCLSIDQPLTQQKHNRNTRVLQGSLYYQSKQGNILGGNPSKTTIHLHYLNPPTMIHNGYSNLMIPVLKHHHVPIQWLWSSLPGQNCRVSAKCLWRANLGTLKTWRGNLASCRIWIANMYKYHPGQILTYFHIHRHLCINDISIQLSISDSCKMLFGHFCWSLYFSAACLAFNWTILMTRGFCVNKNSRSSWRPENSPTLPTSRFSSGLLPRHSPCVLYERLWRYVWTTVLAP